MPTDHRAELAKIKRFDQLIAYLRDKLDWPIARDSFEDVDNLFYDFTPEELGIDPKTASKIESIKRLRPLSARQPWGIFFVKFEPGPLPVVALRRILSQVVIKKRASGKAAERAAWSVDDLLFVSNYGEGEERQISFAHFSQDGAKIDLPTLKVLGWDNRDTPLHLDAVAEMLTSKLAWPVNDDIESWRKTWRSAFTLRHRETITTSRILSIELAKLARAIRDRIRTAIAIETERGPLTKLMKAFQQALIHDLNAAAFADMYAQTIAYGLLSARIANPKANTADHLSEQMPVTNPFLKDLMETFLNVGGRRGKAGGPGIDFDELGVSDIVELLDDSNMEAVVRDFGDKNPEEDPVIHFYELFAKEYDPIDKVRRGEFYTPRPVVSYIVRSVHELFRTKFGLADGLADTTTWGKMTSRHKGLKIPDGISPEQAFIQILDPAAGTGTFLVEVIEIIHKTLIARWKLEGQNDRTIEMLWNEYVPKHLLPRLHAFELKMAPYAIAHLKVGLKLFETGYLFRSDERARIYLTNALEPASDVQLALGYLPALAHEAQAVNTIKRHQHFTVVIGNPPYSNFGQLNKNPFILELLQDYKRGLDEKKINLDDDFIKFIRFSQITIEKAGVGVFSFITNNVYLDGITHRRMRQSLQETFPCAWFLDLHGSAKKLETSRECGKEENVFDIQQGVSIGVFARTLASAKPVVYHADLWGTRESKYRTLNLANITSTSWGMLTEVLPGVKTLSRSA